MKQKSDKCFSHRRFPTRLISCPGESSGFSVTNGPNHLYVHHIHHAPRVRHAIHCHGVRRHPTRKARQCSRTGIWPSRRGLSIGPLMTFSFRSPSRTNQVLPSLSANHFQQNCFCYLRRRIAAKGYRKHRRPPDNKRRRQRAAIVRMEFYSETPP